MPKKPNSQKAKQLHMKVLIVRFSSIGDIVLTTPVIRCLKKQAGVTIHYLTKKNFKGILESNPYVDKVITIEKEITEVLTELKAEKYDHIIDLHKNLRTFRLKLSLGVPSHAFHKLNIEKWLLVNFKINCLPNKHIVDRNLETVQFLNVVNDGEGLDYFIPTKDEVDIVANFGKKYASYTAFAIGAQHATKRLPTLKIIEFCKQLDSPILLLGGSSDISVGDEIINCVSCNVINTCGKFNLNQSASLVRQAQKVITHDTGLMHIAAAFQKDIISIWGSTVPEFGMYPYYKDSIQRNTMLQNRNLSCRPCSKIGFPSCPKGHFKCMNDIELPID